MILHIKNMVSNRCKILVTTELEKLRLQFQILGLGEVEILDPLSEEQLAILNKRFKETGLAVITEKKKILIEKIKNTIIELIHYSDEQIKVNFSFYLSQKLNYDYNYLANIFSENEGTTIEHFLLSHRIERVKEFLVYNELNINEIADKLHFSSAAHLSNQFKKMTGLTPSFFRHLLNKSRTPLENV